MLEATRNHIGDIVEVGNCEDVYFTDLDQFARDKYLDEFKRRIHVKRGKRGLVMRCIVCMENKGVYYLVDFTASGLGACTLMKGGELFVSTPKEVIDELVNS